MAQSAQLLLPSRGWAVPGRQGMHASPSLEAYPGAQRRHCVPLSSNPARHPHVPPGRGTRSTGQTVSKRS
eukprot:1409103-Prymnesium_polylepis.1